MPLHCKLMSSHASGYTRQVLWELNSQEQERCMLVALLTLVWVSLASSPVCFAGNRTQTLEVTAGPGVCSTKRCQIVSSMCVRASI